MTTISGKSPPSLMYGVCRLAITPKKKKASVGFPFSSKSKGGRVSPLQGRESRDDSDMQLPNSEIEQKQTVLKL